MSKARVSTSPANLLAVAIAVASAVLAFNVLHTGLGVGFWIAFFLSIWLFGQVVWFLALFALATFFNVPYLVEPTTEDDHVFMQPYGID